MGALLFLRIVHRYVFQHSAGEFVGIVPVFDFALEPPDHDGTKLDRVRVERTGETLPVQQFEEGREALFVAVVGRRRQKEFVFEVIADLSEGLRSLGIERVVSRSAARSYIVCFI